MDSLLASYASSDGEDESPPPPAVLRPPLKPSPSPISSSLPKPRLFSSLPPPKSHHPVAADGERIPPGTTKNPPFLSSSSSPPPPILSSLPPPKPSSSSASSFFSSLPPPKPTNHAPVVPTPKKLVQFRPPVPRSLLNPSDFDEDDDDDRERKRAKEAPPPASSKTISSFLPAPKNSLCLAPALGSGSSSGTARRSVLEEIPAITKAEAINTETVAVMETVGHENYGNYGGNWAGEAGEGKVDAAGYASYAHASEFYGTDDAAEYGGYVGGREASCWTPSYGGTEAEHVPDVGRILGRRGRNEVPADIMEVKQDELMKNRPREDQSKMTGIAFGPGYKPVSSAKGGKPSKIHKRKHQIGSLYFDMRQKEMELAERRSRGLLTKAETHAKYGW